MRHEYKEYEQRVDGTMYYVYYNDTYKDKTIAEVCAVNNVRFFTFEEVIRTLRSEGSYSFDRFNMRYRGVLCKDGFFAVGRYDTFYPKKKYVYKPRPYYIPTEGEVLGKDMFGNPLHAGDTIIYTKNKKLWFLQIITKTPTMLKVNLVDNPRKYPFNIVKNPNSIAKYTKIG